MIGVYAIRNKKDGRAYIGSSVDVESRMRGHKSMLKRGKHYNRLLQGAFDTFGEDSFEFIVLEANVPTDNLRNREEYYTSLYGTNLSGKGYNIRKEVLSNKGISLTDESKSRIRKSKMGSKNPFYHRTHTEESRKKMSTAHSGTRAYWYGKKLPPDLIKKRSKAMKGKLAGAKNPSAKINFSIAEQIRSEISGGKKIRDIAKEYHLSSSLIYEIKLNHLWAKEQNGTQEAKYEDRKAEL